MCVVSKCLITAILRKPLWSVTLCDKDNLKKLRADNRLIKFLFCIGLLTTSRRSPQKPGDGPVRLPVLAVCGGGARGRAAVAGRHPAGAQPPAHPLSGRWAWDVNTHIHTCANMVNTHTHTQRKARDKWGVHLCYFGWVCGFTGCLHRTKKWGLDVSETETVA